jgi:purine nucleosidase
MKACSRRRVMQVGLAGAALLTAPRLLAQDRPVLSRVILDNDFAGDPDGLFQLAHHLLSPSVHIPLIVGTHLPANFQWDTSPHQATDAANKARELLAVMDIRRTVVAGAETGMVSRQQWQPSPATEAIVREIMREDRTEPVYYCAGAGLTELALAWLAEPRIGPKVTLVWIGGNEHPGLALPPPGADQMEFNYSIDPVAAQIIFNESDIAIWQVPRDAYRQLLISNAELAELRETGPLGAYLVGQIEGIWAALKNMPGASNLIAAETYILGDNPLVTLTALQAFFQPDPSSSHYHIRPTPRVDDTASYHDRPEGRPMRIYDRIDTRLTFADMAAKFRAFDRGRV